MESLLDLLRQIDVSRLGDLGEIDWTDIATYGAITLAFAGIVWTSSKNFIQFIWQKTEGLIGFVISTLVVISLWYTILRVHVSISFNLDKEVFDNLLWFSAILFTPYYLIHYNLLSGFLLTLVRSLELAMDVLIFSWFPEKADQNRQKWRNRVSHAYKNAQASIEDFFQKGVTAAQASQMPFGLDFPKSSETAVSEPVEIDDSITADDSATPTIETT